MPLDPSHCTPKKRAPVLGVEMAFVECGEGDPVVFLHGNPTSSYLWRNVIPHVEALGRCIAPDLVGMGDSSKLPGSGPGRYSFAAHRRHLDALLEQQGVARDVVLVVHDWGSALGFDWARRHPDRVRGIAYMEAIVRPYRWSDMGEHAAFLRSLRGPEGETLVLRDNAFVERFLPRLVLRELAEKEMDAYRRPFLEPGESRRPTLDWPRQIPIDGEPAETASVVAAYSEWLAKSPIPKLLVVAEPGAAIAGPMLEHCRRWPKQTEVRVPGLHFLQEDSPDAIGSALAAWLRGL
jgi:haloalkane dehalogenase